MEAHRGVYLYLDVVLRTLVRYSVVLQDYVLRLALAQQVALYAHGVDEEPFSFASASPLGLSFIWSAINIDVLSLVSVYEKVTVL